MPQFAANLNWMYTEQAFPDRFEAAARDGFKAVELLSPYSWPAAGLKALLNAHGLQLVLFNAPPGGVDAASIERAWGDPSVRGTACPGMKPSSARGLHWRWITHRPRPARGFTSWQGCCLLGWRVKRRKPSM